MDIDEIEDAFRDLKPLIGEKVRVAKMTKAQLDNYRKEMEDKEKELYKLERAVEGIIEKGLELKFEKEKVYELFEIAIDNRIYEIIDKWLKEKKSI